MNAAEEQELRDRLLEAMADCNQIEAEIVMAEMAAVGMEPQVVAANILLDLTEEQRRWWETQPSPPLLVVVSEAIDKINEAARRKGGEAKDDQ